MVCTSLGSLLRPLFYFLCYIHFSLSEVAAGLGRAIKCCKKMFEPELLTIMIATRFVYSIVGNDRLQSISGSIDHNSMIVTCDHQNFQLYLDFGVD